ncbi:MAG: CBS domain-containing protein [Rhodospirillales bacterium]|nr:CBS domain-containing protein [Rhodospirillales bacterium]
MPRKIIPDIIDEQEIAQLPLDCTIREAGRYMVKHDVGSVLVMDGEKLEGIFTERDALRIFVATRRSPDQTAIADVMTRDLKTISPDASPEEALQSMIEGSFRHMPVVDDTGRVFGVISQRDLITS